MDENKPTEITKKAISERSIVYNCWNDFWNDMCEEKLHLNVPIRFYWSGDEELGIALMSVNVAQMEKRTILECIINNVSKEQFSEYTNFYRETFIQNFEKDFVKTLEDY